MKRRVSLILALLFMLSGIALAKTVGDIIPKTSLWTVSREDFKKAVKGKYSEIEVNQKHTLKASSIKIDGFTMDGYYMFAENMRTHYGLSKVTYLLSGKNLSTDDLSKAYTTLVSKMEKKLGKADSATKSHTTWQRDKYKVEIGKGKFKAYNGSEKSTVAIVVTGLNMPTPRPSPTPTPKPSPIPTLVRTPKPTKTPKPAKVKQQTYTQSYSQRYVLNIKTKKFHYPSCGDVGKMNSENRQDFKGSRDDIIRMGYSPCGHCDP